MDCAMHKHATPLLSLSLRIDLVIDAPIGAGKIELFEAIVACGSISAAGRMSYKRAWELVDEVNHICGCKAVTRRIGGRNGGGMVIPLLGRP
jgi:molybdate transport system regulatory protein